MSQAERAVAERLAARDAALEGAGATFIGAWMREGARREATGDQDGVDELHTLLRYRLTGPLGTTQAARPVLACLGPLPE
jgi:hypothetical protein